MRLARKERSNGKSVTAHGSRTGRAVDRSGDVKKHFCLSETVTAAVDQGQDAAQYDM
jgi:hypothetical protein